MVQDKFLPVKIRISVDRDLVIKVGKLTKQIGVKRSDLMNEALEDILSTYCYYNENEHS